MATTTKITALSAVADADISATDVLPLVDTAGTPTTYKVTLAQMRTALLAASGAGWTAADYVAMGAGTVPSSGMLRSGQGAITADSPLVNSTAEWNNVAVTFRHLLVNVTDTASAAGSLLADWQVGGVTKFSVSKAGAVTSGTVNGQTISSTASFTGSVAVASGLTVGGSGVTVSAGGIAVNAGTTAVQALTATTAQFSGAVTLSGVNITPTSDNTCSVGTAALRFSDMRAVTATFSSTVTVASGGLTVSSGTTAVQALTATTGQFSGAGVSVAVDKTATAGTLGMFNIKRSGTSLGWFGCNASDQVAILNSDASAVLASWTNAGAFAIAAGLTVSTGGVTISAGGLAVTGGITGTLSTAAQPNITSVGVLAAPHMTSPVIDSGGLTVTAGTISASSSLVQSGNLQVFNTWDGANTAGVLKLTSDTAATATAGAASLPASPAGFLKWRLGGSAVLIPYYNA